MDAHLPRLHDVLGDVAARQDLLPHAVGEFVAPVGRAATVACKGFEEQVLALGPQTLGVGGLHGFRPRDHLQQHLPDLLVQVQAVQKCRIRQEAQIAFVRIQGMRMRMGREHHRLIAIGLAQGRTSR